jgi:hypothetical protein
MKAITNFRKATVADVEANGLDDATKLHILSCTLEGDKRYNIRGSNHDKLRQFLKYHLKNKIPIVMHNGICYDIPLLSRLLGIDLSELMVIDSLGLSWYLNTDRKIHGLNSFYEDYGIKKVSVEDQDWDFQSDCPKELEAHYKRMKLRCEVDVQINKSLWEDLLGRLTSMYTIVKESVDNGLVEGTRMSEKELCYIDQYKQSSSVDDYIERIITFLMFKMDCARLQEKTRFKVDMPRLGKLEKKLEALILGAKLDLEVALPKVAKYAVRNFPKKPFKQDRSYSAAGLSWNTLVDKLETEDSEGNALAVKVDETSIKELTGYSSPKISSPAQIKDWLFSHGWKPKTFKFVKDKKAQQVWVDSGFRKELKPKPRAVPQINQEKDTGKELCDSVVKLAIKIPEIMAYSKYTLIKHRYDVIKGFRRDMSEDGYLKARIGGLTNTLRVKHRQLANLPAINKEYGEDIRGVLIAGDGKTLLGSDLSSLEDRVKHHFMLAHDPEYVETMMSPDYDPHATMALTAGMITQEVYEGFIAGTLSKEEQSLAKAARRKGKSTNYSSVYNAGPEAIALAAEIPLREGKLLHTAYWQLNWSVKSIAEEQCVFQDDNGDNWLINPINGFCYSLRKDSDRFSTLCQGTGSFFFDMWVDIMLTKMYDLWGRKSLSASFHDEVVLALKDSPKLRKVFEKLVLEAIDSVNKKYILRRDLGADVQFGNNYSEIH